MRFYFYFFYEDISIVMPKESKRGSLLNQSPIRRLVPLARQAKQKGHKVLHLNIGQPDIETPEAALEMVRKHPSPIVKYGPSEGLPELRATVRDYYDKFNANLIPEDIYVTTGASEAILFALFATCNEGDEIIIPEPFYANYIGFAQVCSVSILPVTTSLESKFALPDPSEFEALITPRTKAIFLCNPGNPTGQLYDKAGLEALSAVVLKHDLFLIVDEVYREFCYNKPFTSVLALQELRDNVIVIDSISKVFSSCGARVGYLITSNRGVKQAVIKYAQLRLCPPYFGQLLALACYENGDAYIDKAREEYRKRRSILSEGLKEIPGVQSYIPEAAFYNIAQLPVENARIFCRWLLTDYDKDGQTVMLAPADGFYFNQHLGQQQVRIAYVLNEDDLKAALAVLKSGLEAYAQL